MHGLTVRWSLAQAGPEAARDLAEYVATASHAKFTGMAGLRFKTWRMRAGEWFEGDYVFSSDAERAAFQATFTEGADQAPISVMLGRSPDLIEPHEVLAVAEGWEGFVATPDLPHH